MAASQVKANGVKKHLSANQFTLNISKRKPVKAPTNTN